MITVKLVTAGNCVKEIELEDRETLTGLLRKTETSVTNAQLYLNGKLVQTDGSEVTLEHQDIVIVVPEIVAISSLEQAKELFGDELGDKYWTDCSYSEIREMEEIINRRAELAATHGFEEMPEDLGQQSFDDATK